MSIEEQILSVARMVERDIDGHVRKGDLAAALVAHYRGREMYDEIDAARKALWAVLDKADKAILPKLFEHMGVDHVRVPEVKRSFYTQVRYSASLVDKAKGIEWLRNNGASELVSETVNAGTLAAYCKSLITEQGIDPPEEVIKVSTYTTIGSSKVSS